MSMIVSNAGAWKLTRQSEVLTVWRLASGSGQLHAEMVRPAARRSDSKGCKAIDRRQESSLPSARVDPKPQSSQACGLVVGCETGWPGHWRAPAAFGAEASRLARWQVEVQPE